MTSFSDEDSKAISRHAFPLHGEAHAIGKTIRELPLSAHHLKLLFIRRKTGKIQDLDPDFVLENGDIFDCRRQAGRNYFLLKNLVLAGRYLIIGQ